MYLIFGLALIIIKSNRKRESPGKAESVGTASPAENSAAKELQAQEGDNEVENDITFNFETKTVMLNSGYEMPIYGIGTYSLTDEVCVDSVTAALENGIRLIDMAYMYHNEESVGEAVRNSGIPREEIFEKMTQAEGQKLYRHFFRKCL